jgi:DNA-binding transcriptional ArsR family regulator
MENFSGTEKRRHKEQLYHLFTQVASAMANPHRLELLDLLVQAPRTVEELAKEAHMSVANTSQHLQRLKQGRLVLDEREGLYIRYRLADPAVARLWLELRAVAERQLAEVERALDALRPYAPYMASRLERPLPWGRLRWSAVDERPPVIRKTLTPQQAIEEVIDEVLNRLVDPRREPADRSHRSFATNPSARPRASASGNTSLSKNPEVCVARRLSVSPARVRARHLRGGQAGLRPRRAGLG